MTPNLRLAATLLAATALSAPALAAGTSQAHPAVVEQAPASQASASSGSLAPSLHHWSTMAKIEAQQLSAALGSSSGPWHVKAAKRHDSEFAQLFVPLLTAELAGQGVRITTDASSANSLELNILNSPVLSPEYKPGSLTMLAGGLWLVHGVTSSFSPLAATTVLAAAADGLMTWVDHKKDRAVSELALNVVAKRGHEVLSANTNVYVVQYKGLETYADKPGSVLSFSK